MGWRRLATLSFLVLLLPTVAGNTGYHQHEGPGHVWLAIDHREQTSIEAIMYGIEGGAAVGVRLFDDAGESVMSLTFRRVDPHPFIAVTLANATFSQTAERHVAHDGGSILRWAGPPAKLYALIWGAGNLEGIDWRISQTGTDSGFTRIGSGSRAFYSEGEGFEAETQVVARTNRGSILHQEGGRMTVSPVDRFIGIVGFPSYAKVVGSQNVTVSHTAGSRECPCAFASFDGENSMPAGPFTIHRNMTLVEVGATSTLLVGVDVPWPPRAT